MNAAEGRYYDDLVIGEVFESSARTVSLDELLEFATRYDPQYFHADPITANTSSAIGSRRGVLSEPTELYINWLSA